MTITITIETPKLGSRFEKMTGRKLSEFKTHTELEQAWEQALGKKLRVRNDSAEQIREREVRALRHLQEVGARQR